MTTADPAPTPRDAHALADQLAAQAKAAAPAMARATGAQKDAALDAIARRLEASAAEILAANARDLEAAREAGLSSALLDRLRLNEARVAAMAAGVREVRALPDPVGRIEDATLRPNGLRVGRMRIPLGVIAIIYEARPNVTIDAGVLCLKSGNVPILKGGREALHANQALVRVMRAGLQDAGLPADAVQAVATSDRQVILDLIRKEGEVDLVIPRGGEGLVRTVTHNALVPVLQHYKGVCHVYVHADADLDMAADIAFNAKVQRPGVCNAMETLLVHREAARDLVPRLFPRLEAAGVELRGDARTRALWPGAKPVSEEDWATEYLDLVLSVALVDDIDAAMAHIATYGSGHTEAIVTRDYAASQRFLSEVQSSCVLVNASTRFNDGFELGLGAEIGISTTKLHAYGPMGLEELTARKFVVWGAGQVRGAQ